MILITGDPITGGIPLSAPFFIYTINLLDPLGSNCREEISGDLVIDVPGKKVIFRHLKNPEDCRKELEEALLDLFEKDIENQKKIIHFDINQYENNWYMDSFEVISTH